jgi:hypothetical protein
MLSTGVDRLFHDVVVIVNGRRGAAVEFCGSFYLPNGTRLDNAQRAGRRVLPDLRAAPRPHPPEAVALMVGSSSPRPARSDERYATGR